MCKLIFVGEKMGPPLDLSRHPPIFCLQILSALLGIVHITRSPSGRLSLLLWIASESLLAN